MIGTPEQPWINTDPFLDIDRLVSLEMDIIKGICTSIEGHGITVYGTNVINWPSYHAIVNQIESMPIDDPRRVTYYEILSHFPENHPLQASASRLFTKLCFGVYSGGPFILLRREANKHVRNMAAFCSDTENIVHFSSLMDFIGTLPFTEIGRILIFLNDHNLVTPIHTDDTPKLARRAHKKEFLWLSPNKNKVFFIYDEKTKLKHYITSHSAFFNENHWHGTDPVPKMNFSIRIDGFFTDEFREQLGITHLENYNII